MIKEIAQVVLEQLQREHPREYEFHGWSRTQNQLASYSIQWNEISMEKRDTCCTLHFNDDHVLFGFSDKILFKSSYCDPEFPDSLINCVKNGKNVFMSLR